MHTNGTENEYYCLKALPINTKNVIQPFQIIQKQMSFKD